MTFSQLQIFSLIAELGSFTAVASRIGISQSAVSHALKALESELGVELLRRSGGVSVPTDIGQTLLLRARTLLALEETMRQEAAAARGMKRGTLRIGSFGPTASMRLLPKILAAYRAEYPDIDIHIDEGPDRDVLHWLESQRIDIGFAVLPQERFDTYPLLRDQMVALLPASHPLAQAEAVRLAELCHDPFVLTEAGSAELVQRLFVGAQQTPVVRYRCAQLMSTLAAVARGDGVSLVAELALPAVPTGDYVAKPLQPPVTRDVALAMLDERQASPAALAFVRVAKQLRERGALRDEPRDGLEQPRQ